VFLLRSWCTHSVTQDVRSSIRLGISIHNHYIRSQTNVRSLQRATIDERDRSIVRSLHRTTIPPPPRGIRWGNWILYTKPPQTWTL
jgi:hypothetical protein